VLSQARLQNSTAHHGLPFVSKLSFVLFGNFLMDRLA